MKPPKHVEMDPHDVVARLVGKVVQGIEIDADNETVIVRFDDCLIEFTGDGLEMYYELPDMTLDS